MASRNIGASEDDLAALHKAVTEKLLAQLRGTDLTPEVQAGLRMSIGFLKNNGIEVASTKASSGLSIKEPLPFPTDDDLDEGAFGRDAQEG